MEIGARDEQLSSTPQYSIAGVTRVMYGRAVMAEIVGINTDVCIVASERECFFVEVAICGVTPSPDRVHKVYTRCRRIPYGNKPD